MKLEKFSYSSKYGVIFNESESVWIKAHSYMYKKDYNKLFPFFRHELETFKNILDEIFLFSYC